MSFPYTYTDKIYFSRNKKDINSIESLIVKNLLNKHSFSSADYDKTDILKAHSPFLKIPFLFEFEINSGEINYKIHLDQLLKIILIVIIFAALFSYASLSFFFWFASLFSVLFYILNIMIINSYIHSIISKILEKNKLSVSEKESLSEEQETWLNDKSRCPACGHYLSDIDLSCPECGLHLKRSRHTIPLDTSKYKNESVKYHYKKK